MKDIPKETVGRDIARGEIAFGSWGIIEKLFKVISSLIILRSFTLYEFGVYQLASSVYSFINDNSANFFGNTMLADLSRLAGNGENREAWTLFRGYSFFRLVLALLAAVALLFAGFSIPREYGPAAFIWASELAIILVFDTALSLLVTYLSAYIPLREIAWRGSLQQGVQAAMLILLATLGGLSIQGLLFAEGAGVFVAFIAFFSRFLGIAPRYRVQVRRGVSVFYATVRTHGKWDAGNTLIKNAVAYVRPWFMKLFLGTEAVGLYGAALSLVTLIADLLPIRSPQMLVPRHAQDGTDLSGLYPYILKYYLYLSLALAGAAALVVGPLLPFFFPRYAPAVPIIYILLPLIFLYTANKLSNIYLISFREQKLLFRSTVAQTTLTIVLLAVALPFFGLIGAALSDLFSIGVTARLKYEQLRGKRLVRKFRLRSLGTFDRKDRAAVALVAGIMLEGVRSLLPRRYRP